MVYGHVEIKMVEGREKRRERKRERQSGGRKEERGKIRSQWGSACVLSSSSCVYVFCQDCVLLRERIYIYI